MSNFYRVLPVMRFAKLNKPPSQAPLSSPPLKVRRINKKRTFDKFSYISIEYMCELPANFQEHPKDDGGQARVYLLAERNVSFDLLGKFQLLAKKLKK